jgi:hypothetical protein
VVLTARLGRRNRRQTRRPARHRITEQLWGLIAGALGLDQA